ncbi:hypothetical protein [Billgrantia gudaonensis]|uniref:GGDEF domain-containing protein, diguanylate cyclase (C-di-GMP synthetase) or its enzymatically inactive variants n=1 Tax=Billgrantia gudaonensis TaxID=376427 RepID=A0A1G8TGY5_9GAMM|nr:hypothetical protein [Halomonas gudaonensis]SDJ39940.1 hypothetical protein SAMN04487954_104283 [Halomonas gudaonensis]
MQSKYKVGLMRLNLLAGALLLALIASRQPQLADALLLWLGVLWLTLTAALLEFSHRRPGMLPWQLLPGLLLTGVLWTAPERFALWLWLWPAVLLMPQPTWTLAVNLCLAGVSWWTLYPLLGPFQAVFAGLALGVLTAIAMARRHQTQQPVVRQRVRLVPGLPLWSAHQLTEDLPRERARCQREGVHGELLLLEVPRHQLWATARMLCHQLYDFESCYRLDSRTLAALLLSRDDDQASQRRAALMDTLPTPRKTRFMSLATTDDLETPLADFQRQPVTPAVGREFEHG